MFLVKLNYLRSILTIFFVTVLLTSCGYNRILGYKKDEFINRVNKKDYRFLSDVDYLKNSIKEINRLGDGASYYMSFVYKNNGMRLFSNKLLYQEIQNKDPYYGPLATVQLLKQLLQEKDYIKAEMHALNFFDKYKVDNPQVTKQLIEAIYWQRKDEQVIPYIENLDRGLYSAYANYEFDLLKCVSSARLGKENWEELYKELFFNQPLSPILSRAYSFIDVYPDYGEGFTSKEREYFRAMSLASSGDYYSAQRILRPLLRSEDWIFKTKDSIKNISKIIKSSRVVTANLSSFESAMLYAPDDMKDDALVSYASLYFNIERFSVVVSLLEHRLNSMDIGKTKDDALWLYLLSLSHVETERVVSRVKSHIGQLSGEKYPSDILDHVITALVQNEEWDSIEDIEDTAKEYGSVTVQSRVSWILSRLYFYEYLPSENSQVRFQEKLDQIVIQDNSSYYSYIANALLKRESNLILSDPDPVEELNDDDLWIQGFLKYGLSDEAELFSRQIEKLNYNVAIEVADSLGREGKHLTSLRFLAKAKVPLNSESFPLYYPLPYKGKIVEVSSVYGLPHTIYSGLIRTESGFDMDVVSGAGAVGLSQLMPATAREQALNIGIDNPDLNDPDTNIQLGGSYLNWLMSKYGTLPLSCMAYNAGPGNVWEWQRGWGNLPDELFIEAAPFKETRAYVPKILRSAIYYGHEEFNISPYQVVKQIFPNIDRI